MFTMPSIPYHIILCISFSDELVAFSANLYNFCLKGIYSPVELLNGRFRDQVVCE